MKKFRNVPAIVTLLAGFVISVVMIQSRYALVTFLWVLVFAMTSFYIVGLLLRFLLNKAFAALEQKEGEEESGDGENTDKETAIEDGMQGGM